MDAGGAWWRPVAEPEQDGDSWSVVFRLDGRGSDAAGPRIVVTAAARQESVRGDHLGHGPAPVFEVGHVMTVIDYEVLGPSGRAADRLREIDPDVFLTDDGMPTIERARRLAEDLVRTLDPLLLEWDGSPDTLARANSGWHGVRDESPARTTHKWRTVSWLDVPAGSLLTVRRLARTGHREQWAVTGREGDVIVQQARSGDESWREAGRFETLSDAVTGTAGLREMHAGTVTLFDVDEQAPLTKHDLAAFLDLCSDEGDDDLAAWTDANLEACSWNFPKVWPWAVGLPLIRRLAAINGTEVCGVFRSGKCVPVLANKDGLVPSYILARTGTRPRSGVSLPGWDSGSDLVVLAPALACSMPWGEGEESLFLVDYPEQGAPEEIAAVIAGWLKSVAHDFWAALALEPLDSDGMLDHNGRAAWEGGQHALVDPILGLPEDVRPLLRVALSGISASYARCAEARAYPTGHVARVLLASSLQDLHSGRWIQGLDGWPAAAEDHSQLAGLQSRTFARASAVTAAAYPSNAQLTGAQLAVFLDTRAFAVVGSTQPDGRPHAVVTSYLRRGTTFWLPMVAGTASERNLQTNPWLALTATDGGHDGYTGVQIEGPAETVPVGDVPPNVRDAVGTWVRAWLRLTATRLLSHASHDRPWQMHHTK